MKSATDNRERGEEGQVQMCGPFSFSECGQGAGYTAQSERRKGTWRKVPFRPKEKTYQENGGSIPVWSSKVMQPL